MIRNLMKVGILGMVTSLSLNAASQTINEMVIQVHNREKTIADTLIKQQVQEVFQEAEKAIEKVEVETQKAIKQEEVVMKPPMPPKPQKEQEALEVEEVQLEEVEQEQVVESEPIEPREEKQDLEQQVTTDAQLDITTYYNLTPEDKVDIGNYLVEHYFLFGYDYYQAETDPIRYARKKLTSDMEDYVITSLAESLDLLSNIQGLKGEQVRPLVEKAILLSQEFRDTYKDVGNEGEEFEAIYKSIEAFMDTYVSTLNKVEDTFKLIEETTNKALVLPMFLKGINQDILPSVKEVLQKGFDLKEQTNKIYIEGIDHDFLMTPEEVMAILENPTSVLSTLEETQEKEVILESHSETINEEEDLQSEEEILESEGHKNEN